MDCAVLQVVFKHCKCPKKKSTCLSLNISLLVTLVHLSKKRMIRKVKPNSISIACAALSIAQHDAVDTTHMCTVCIAPNVRAKQMFSVTSDCFFSFFLKMAAQYESDIICRL